MRIAILDTYYPKFLKEHYRRNPRLKQRDSATQLSSLLESSFGTSDFYSHHLAGMGHEVIDLIANCVQLQDSWARENKIPFNALAIKLPHRIFRLPLVGRRLAALPGLIEIAVVQIKAFKPDVLYCQDLSFFPGGLLREIKKEVKLIVGQIACPLPPKDFLGEYDLILTSFPHFVDRLKELGIASEYFKIGFDTRILNLLGPISKDIDVSFVGGISRHHNKAIPLLEHLATKTPIQFFGYGVKSLPRNSTIRKGYHGEIWGLEMYRTLARSKITLNRHINTAENYANNMRLYEATGVGTMLLTDCKDNLQELFDIGNEVVTYSSKEEAAEMVHYYLDHPREAQRIAKAGQERTLREHTYAQRMQELVPILKKYMVTGR
jgi:hypothetical protein